MMWEWAVHIRGLGGLSVVGGLWARAAVVGCQSCIVLVSPSTDAGHTGQGISIEDLLVRPGGGVVAAGRAVVCARAEALLYMPLPLAPAVLSGG